MLEPLYQYAADPAGGRVDQHRIAGLEGGPDPLGQEFGGHALEHGGRRHVERDLRRDVHQAIGRHHIHLGIGALAAGVGYPVAGLTCVTPSPTASTTPAASLPGVKEAFIG